MKCFWQIERTTVQIAIISAAALLASTLARAAPSAVVTAASSDSPDPPAAPMPEWTAKGQVGFVDSTGNAEAQTANAKSDIAQASDPWKNTLHLEALYAKSASVVSAERWAGLFQSNYQLTKPLFVFGELHYTDDKFSGFSYQASADAGVGDVLLNTASNKLSVQLGVGYRDLRPELLIDDAAGQITYRVPEPIEEDAIATASIDAEHDFNASTKITDKALTETGASDTLVENDLSLQVQMTRRLALSVGYSVQYNSSPPGDVKSLDTLTTLNLVFQL